MRLSLDIYSRDYKGGIVRFSQTIANAYRSRIRAIFLTILLIVFHNDTAVDFFASSVCASSIYCDACRSFHHFVWASLSWCVLLIHFLHPGMLFYMFIYIQWGLENWRQSVASRLVLAQVSASLSLPIANNRMLLLCLDRILTLFHLSLPMQTRKASTCWKMRTSGGWFCRCKVPNVWVDGFLRKTIYRWWKRGSIECNIHWWHQMQPMLRRRRYVAHFFIATAKRRKVN